MKRRAFLTWAGIGWFASLLSSAIGACTPRTNQSKSSRADRTDGFQSVGTVAALDRDGQILNKDLAAGPVLVFRNPATPNTLLAVNPTCTHRGCTVEWKGQQKLLVCPCHGAQYSADGKVIKEPAEKPLSTYTTKIEGEQVLVKV